MRKTSTERATVVIGSMAAIVLAPATATAQYLDPGAGSIIVQVVIAVVIGVSATVKLYWHRISGFLNNRRAKSKRES